MAVDLSFYKSSLSEEIRDEGRAQGLEQGLEQGHVQRAAEDVLLVLEQRGLEVTDEVRGLITGCGDAELLRAWLVRAVVVSEAEEIFEGE
ncbi:hypothetical protein [Streptomyces hirsutus]|uniref:hypothetical protein n=1 Tax=Streptomyces hirsutus TaxID=35620 RepID=UPI0038647523